MDSQIPQIRFVPQALGQQRGFMFDVIERQIPNGAIVKIGRYTDRIATSNDRIVFKSKVVSRNHAEIWSEDSKFFIKDTRSSSGTFLNQLRLSSPNHESKPHQLTDGDILQLGVDYQGGTQEVFKCVKIRIEMNRSWQRHQQNPFRVKAIQTIQALRTKTALGKSTNAEDETSECAICLCTIGAFQALFTAPCSHTYHYKCIKSLISEDLFVCPVCRTYADLNEEIYCDDEFKLDPETPQVAEQPLKNNQISTNAVTLTNRHNPVYENNVYSTIPERDHSCNSLVNRELVSANSHSVNNLPSHDRQNFENADLVSGYSNLVESVDLPRHTRSASEMCINQDCHALESPQNDANTRCRSDRSESLSQKSESSGSCSNNRNTNRNESNIAREENDNSGSGRDLQQLQNRRRSRPQGSRKSSFSRLFGDVLRAFDTRK